MLIYEQQGKCVGMSENIPIFATKKNIHYYMMSQETVNIQDIVKYERESYVNQSITKNGLTLLLKYLTVGTNSKGCKKKLVYMCMYHRFSYEKIYIAFIFYVLQF